MKITNRVKPFTISIKSSILDICWVLNMPVKQCSLNTMLLNHCQVAFTGKRGQRKAYGMVIKDVRYLKKFESSTKGKYFACK